jgi:hypothetical protein
MPLDIGIRRSGVFKCIKDAHGAEYKDGWNEFYHWGAEVILIKYVCIRCVDFLHGLLPAAKGSLPPYQRVVDKFLVGQPRGREEDMGLLNS